MLILNGAFVSILGNLRFDYGNINNNATNQLFDWLNEEKLSCGTCGTLFGAMFWRSPPNDDVKFSYLRIWRQRKLAAVNLSLFAFTWKPFVPSISESALRLFCTTWSTRNLLNMKFNFNVTFSLQLLSKALKLPIA